jgi:hypothetical protein
MQIRLTVLAPRSGQAAGRAFDVLVTAPPGTALAAVASGLATAVLGPDASGTVAVYRGTERLDTQRCALGEPPLVDGAVVSLQAPGAAETPWQDAPAQLKVVAGPDAGGVHLLHGGRIMIGRSAEADVPLDDPDVSRLHCAVTVSEDGAVTVADLGSTNGTTVEGVEVGREPVRLGPGALLGIGESTLVLASGDRSARLPATPDGEGHLRVAPIGGEEEAPASMAHDAWSAGGQDRAAQGGRAGGTRGAGGPAPVARTADAASEASGATQAPPGRPSPVPAPRAPGTGDTESGQGVGFPTEPLAAGPAGAERGTAQGGQGRGPRQGVSDATHGRGGSYAVPADTTPGGSAAFPHVPAPRGGGAGYGSGGDTPAHGRAAVGAEDGAQPHGNAGHGDVPGTAGEYPVPASARRRGLGAWARRLAGGRPEAQPGGPVPRGAEARGWRAPAAETWPDPAEVLLTVLGPGPRLWERGPHHPEALVVRLGTADTPAHRSSGPLAEPVTVSLREAGSLGLAGPRERLTGLARSVVAQLAALHAPSDLEIVLITTDRALSPEQRRQDWGWLGWLPHVRPAHGQDCRLLLAYDRDQAAARAAELSRRLDEGPLGPGWASAGTAAVAAAAQRHTGPRTLLIVDGDPGSAALRETTARLAGAGPAAGVHVLCLAETPAASAVSSVTATYDMACAASLPFRECGAFALLSGDVAGALRLLRATPGQSLGEGRGTVAVVDAVSAAWAERFGRALAPLRTTAHAKDPGPATPLPRTARLLDELGLARATPASLLARWASADDAADEECTAVLGAGARGPVGADLAQDGPHLLIEGPAGSGRTELLRAVAASLAAGARPDRLGLLLVDGAGGMRGDGLSAVTELPHVTEHLVASDPVRMREFAQALGAELKRRAELLGSLGFAEWHQALAGARRTLGGRAPGEQPGDMASSPTRTLRLRASAVRAAQDQEPSPLPRLVVLVDDFDALVAPALGSPGRPAAGSVVRALEAVARDGERLGVHLVAAAAGPDRTGGTELARTARLRVVLDAPPTAPVPEDPAPGRGRLYLQDGRFTAFQAGRVTGRIPRTATLRPTVVPLEWERMGDPPARRPVRELGNGPTDLALLASALERAARSVAAIPVAPLTPAHP